MYEIRVYRRTAKTKVRIGTIKKSGNWFGLVAWIRLWFTLRKFKQKMEQEYRRIAADTSTRIIH
jgi:hypothetical protein